MADQLADGDYDADADNFLAIYNHEANNSNITEDD
jgi:hypothetical protein